MEFSTGRQAPAPAKGAENAAQSAQTSPQRVPVNTLDAGLRQEATQ
jgi:hypothetical protein